ncbi:Uncharacterised protein [BD1-7 clade bacterium]|uniref:Uncharacterized protein n=1 Tax=BD1-7 clade bacterium TaxID=2029982 RepID=A0A5S9QWE4_9GAMM|nr:Uncharacterised protein [BD1-7 clade bacterium]
MPAFAEDVYQRLMQEHLEDAEYLFSQLRAELTKPLLDIDYLQDTETRLCRHMTALAQHQETLNTHCLDILESTDPNDSQAMVPAYLLMSLIYSESDWKSLLGWLGALPLTIETCASVRFALQLGDVLAALPNQAHWQQLNKQIWPQVLTSKAKPSASQTSESHTETQACWMAWFLIFIDSDSATASDFNEDSDHRRVMQALQTLEHYPSLHAPIVYRAIFDRPELQLPSWLLAATHSVFEQDPQFTTRNAILLMHLQQRHHEWLVCVLDTLECPRLRTSLGRYITLDTPDPSEHPECMIEHALTPQASPLAVYQQWLDHPCWRYVAATALFYLTEKRVPRIWDVLERFEPEALFPNEPATTELTGEDMDLIDPDVIDYRILFDIYGSFPDDDPDAEPELESCIMGRSLSAEWLAELLATTTYRRLRNHCYQSLKHCYNTSGYVDFAAPPSLQKQQIATFALQIGNDAQGQAGKHA